MKNGGKRAGAGRPKGSVESATLEKREALRRFQGRVHRYVDRLFQAQLALAEGTVYVYVREMDGETVKHRRLTDGDEISAALDDLDGEASNGVYVITANPPDNSALKDMLDRGLGKPSQEIELTTDYAKYGDIRDLTDDKLGDELAELERAEAAAAARTTPPSGVN